MVKTVKVVAAGEGPGLRTVFVTEADDADQQIPVYAQTDTDDRQIETVQAADAASPEIETVYIIDYGQMFDYPDQVSFAQFYQEAYLVNGVETGNDTLAVEEDTFWNSFSPDNIVPPQGLLPGIGGGPKFTSGFMGDLMTEGFSVYCQIDTTDVETTLNNVAFSAWGAEDPTDAIFLDLNTAAGGNGVLSTYEAGEYAGLGENLPSIAPGPNEVRVTFAPDRVSYSINGGAVTSYDTTTFALCTKFGMKVGNDTYCSAIYFYPEVADEHLPELGNF